MSEVVSSLGLRFAVIGAQRGGSTFSADVLSNCCEIDLPRLELPIFEDPWWSREISASELNRVFSTDGSLVRGLKRPDLLGHPEYAPRLRRAGVRACVVVVRDPVERMVSAAFWYVYVGRIRNPVSMDEYLQSVASRFAAGLELSEFERRLVDYSRYGHHVSAWMAWFGVRLILSSPEAVAADPDEFAGEVLEAAGGTPAHAARQARRMTPPTARTNAGFAGYGRLRVLRSRMRFSRTWDNATEFRLNRDATRIWNHVPNRLAVGAVHGLDRLGSLVVRRQPPAVSPATHEVLREALADDVALFRSLSPRCREVAESW